MDAGLLVFRGFSPSVGCEWVNKLGRRLPYTYFSIYPRASRAASVGPRSFKRAITNSSRGVLKVNGWTRVKNCVSGYFSGPSGPASVGHSRRLVKSLRRLSRFALNPLMV